MWDTIKLYKRAIKRAEESWNPFFISQIPEYKRKIALELSLIKWKEIVVEKVVSKKEVKVVEEKKIFLSTILPKEWQFCSNLLESEVTEEMLEREVEFWFDLHRDK